MFSERSGAKTSEFNSFDVAASQLYDNACDGANRKLQKAAFQRMVVELWCWNVHILLWLRVLCTNWQPSNMAADVGGALMLKCAYLWSSSEFWEQNGSPRFEGENRRALLYRKYYSSVVETNICFRRLRYQIEWREQRYRAYFSCSNGDKSLHK